MPDLQVTWVDLAILIAYVALTRLIFGWWALRQVRQHGGGPEAYFLGGRRLTWPIIGLSFYVANMSGGSFVGLAGSGYNDGIAVYHYEWLPAVVLVLFTLFILPFYLRSKVFTSPEFLERRFGRQSRYAFSGFLLTANIVVDVPASLYAGAMIAQALYPGIPVWWTIGLAALIAGIYISFGGLGAVVLNDALQAGLILVGGCLVTYLAWVEVGSWEAVEAAVPPSHLQLMQPPDDDVLPWPGVLTGVFWLSVYFWCTNQFVIQRALGAKNLDHGRWGALFAGLLKLPNLFILILPGVMALVIYPGLENPDLAFPLLAFDLLPVGLRGLMLAVLAAAILSSLEAILNSASTLFTMDFVKNLRPDTPEHALAATGRWATIGFMVLAALWTPVITQFPTLFQYLQSILSYITPPVVVIFIGGIFWPRANNTGALLTLGLGVPAGIVGWTVFELLGWFYLQFLYAAGLSLAVSTLILVGASLASTPPAAEKVAHTTWQKRYWRQESEAMHGKPYWQNYRVLATVLIGVSLLIVAAWW